MNSLKQLLRQPIRSFLYIILMMLSSTILCLSIGLYYSAYMTVKEANSVYTTIALPTDKTVKTQETVGGQVYESEKSVITSEIQEWLDGLADKYPEVIGIYKQKFISSYSEGLDTLVSAMEDGTYGDKKDKPYTNAAFVITINSLENNINGMVDVTAKIDKVLLLHNGYNPEDTLHFTYYYFPEDELQADDLEIGGRYIVFGINYVDRGLVLKKDLADSLKISTHKIDWKNINYDVTNYKDVLTEHGTDVSDVAALYEYNETSIPLTASDLDATKSSWMFVQNPSNFIKKGNTYTHQDGTTETVVATSDEIEASTLPTISKLTIDVDNFLSSDEGQIWREILDQYKITNQSVPVLGTDCLESIFEFHQNKAVITLGRSFKDKEYTSGDRVCIISEELALANGLHVGDKIPLSFYKGLETYMETSYNPPADIYSPLAGFSTENVLFQVIGIYSQSNLWSDSSYSFTPNTVFVPNNAITCDTYTDNTGIFYTIVLKNGSIDKIKSYEELLGYKDILNFYDQGYSEIKDTLTDYLSTAGVLFIIGFTTWVTILILFLILYVARLKHIAGMMLSIGSGRRKTMIHILISTLTITLISTAISGVLGYALLGNIIDCVYSNTINHSVINSDFSAKFTSDTSSIMNLTVQKLPQISSITAIFQFFIYLLITMIYSNIILKKKPLILMKHKEN